MRTARLLTALTLSLALGLTLGGPPASAEDLTPPGGQAAPAGQEHRSDRAEEALAAVEAILAGHGPRARADAHEHGRSYTLALQQLHRYKDALPPAQRKQAEQILQRPGDPTDEYVDVPLPGSTCSAVICVHWTETGTHAPAGSDGNLATVPTYVAQVRDTMQAIHDDYVAAGYRRPKPDGALGGGSNLVDIYLGDIGDAGLYGYCTSDDPNNPDVTGDYSFWTYCTLDNDYAADEFPTNTPLENMQVTAAHEYFHAVQGAYDWWEDGWLLESTAAWVEDELFDAVDDNRQYLAVSPLRMPDVPIDHYGDGFHYGTWIWWRYLTEKFPSKEGKLPTLVRQVWERADGTPSGPDDYSMQALSTVLTQRSTSLRKELQLFSAANRRAEKHYDEGGAYANAPAAVTQRLSPKRKTAGGKGEIKHLASATVHFKPKKLSKRDWKLRLVFDTPPTKRGGAAVVLIHKKSGGYTTKLVKLDKTGAGKLTVPFSTKKVKGIDAILVNTSARYDCWQGVTPYSCFGGIPLDDDLVFKVVGKAFRS